jgi:hypothetical protein
MGALMDNLKIQSFTAALLIVVCCSGAAAAIEPQDSVPDGDRSHGG